VTNRGGRPRRRAWGFYFGFLAPPLCCPVRYIPGWNLTGGTGQSVSLVLSFIWKDNENLDLIRKKKRI
jgi:hypothetical protein